MCPRSVKQFLGCIICNFVFMGITLDASLANGLVSLDETLHLTEVVGQLHYPTGMAHANDGSNRLFIVEQTGTIRIVQDGALLPTPFLNVKAKLYKEGNFLATKNEPGLLNIVFHPLYATNGRFFIFYTDKKNHIVIAEYHVSDNDANIANPNEVKILLTISHPQEFNHYGGSMLFLPDGTLVIGVADGGGVGDPHKHSQDKNILLSKILRIDVDTPLAGKNYGIPIDNPFVNHPGKDEIYAWGFRNPWRMTYDPTLNLLFTGDVGQYRWEEIDLVMPGKNYGWNVMEGPQCYGPHDEPVPTNCKKAGKTKPIYAYPRPVPFIAATTSIILGPMYRGAAITGLQGKLLFSDLTHGFIDSIEPKAGVTDYQKAASWKHTHLFKKTGLIVTSFGTDEAGEAYILHYNGKHSRLYKFEPVS
jgi:glucose/arabinose dehydrogenase